MKHLIIEGPDRCGKNTLITNLLSQSSCLVTRHFGAAVGSTDSEKQLNQMDFFAKEFRLASAKQREILHMPGENHKRDLFIWNRGHLGEFVYGTMYRNTRPENWVIGMESLHGMDKDPEVYLLLLVAHPEFICKNDDGLSFSSKIDDKIKEIELFKDACKKSTIQNKLTICVTEYGENGEIKFRSEKDILNEVNNFLWK